MTEHLPDQALDQYFLEAVPTLRSDAPSDRPPDGLSEPVRAGTRLTGQQALALFDVQIGNRHLDFAARYLRAAGQGFYTIGSSGHEANAAVAAALRPTDPALLPYRPGAFYPPRGAQVPGSNPLLDVLLGLVAAADEPISGGRHK